MLPWLGSRYGNASSVHAYGQAAQEAIENARSQIASLLDVPAPEIVFGASGTELNNAVLFSAAQNANESTPVSGHFVVSGFEHPSILKGVDRLVALGATATRVAPGADGVVSAESIAAALQPDTRLVCVMLANNEVGTVQPIGEISAACREHGVPVLADAVQAIGKIGVSCPDLGADFVTIGAHKFNGPPGTAALRIRSGVPFLSYLVGGSHERGRRASTANVPGLVGIGCAAELAETEWPKKGEKMAALRDRFESGLASVDGVTLHCTEVDRLPNTSHVAFQGVDSESLMIRLDIAGFAVSTGSACSSGTVEPSSGLAAMGMPREEALSSLRVSFGATNTTDEVDRFLAAIETEVAALRMLATAEHR